MKISEYFPRRQKLKAQAQQLRETAVNKRWRLVWRLAKSLCLLTSAAFTLLLLPALTKTNIGINLKDIIENI